MTQSWLQEHFRGIDMPGLNLADVRRVPIPLPPIDEQREIVSQVQKQHRTATSIKRFAQLLSSRAWYIEESILDKTFRGELLTVSKSGRPVRLDKARLQIDSDIRAEHARRKSWRTRPVKKATLDSLKHVIDSLPDVGFSADELRRSADMDYETFKDFLFTLLGESTPLIEQYFDLKSSCIHFRKVAQ